MAKAAEVAVVGRTTVVVERAVVRVAEAAQAADSLALPMATWAAAATEVAVAAAEAGTEAAGTVEVAKAAAAAVAAVLVEAASAARAAPAAVQAATAAKAASAATPASAQRRCGRRRRCARWPTLARAAFSVAQSLGARGPRRPGVPRHPQPVVTHRAPSQHSDMQATYEGAAPAYLRHSRKLPVLSA